MTVFRAKIQTAWIWQILAASIIIFALACGSKKEERRIPPYIVKKGCEFTLVVSNGNSASTTIDKGNTLVTYKLSMGDYIVSVSDCRVVDNPDNLKIYED